MKKLIWSLLSITILGGALAGAVYLGKRSQDVRKGATGSDAVVTIETGANNNSIELNHEIDAKIYIDTGTIAFDFFRMVINPSSMDVIEFVPVLSNTLFTTVQYGKVENNLIKLQGIVAKPAAELPRGMVEIGTLKMKGVANGTVALSLVSGSINDVATGSLVQVSYQGTNLVVTGGATGIGNVDLSFSPGSGNLVVGETMAVNLMAKTNGSKITAATIKLGFDSSKTEVVAVTANSGYTIGNGFVPDGSGLLEGTLLWMTDPSGLVSGDINLATIIIRAKASGSDSLRVVNGSMAGINGSAQGKLDVASTAGSYTYTNAGGVTDTPIPTAEPTGNVNDPLLKFKFAFAGVMPTGANCVNNWPIEVTVKGSDGETKKYSNVATQRDSSITDRAVYEASVRLTGFAGRNNLAVFIKGPKHLQAKYGIDGQDFFYNQAGGSISVSTDKVYDFSKYPLLAGDVTGDAVGVPDGKIDGRDFSFMKAHGSPVSGREEVAAGGYLQADLDGNCFTGVQDSVLLMISLKEKQEQLY